jgi:hypothetical protein
MNIAFLALMFGIWRLTDGGFHRHPVSTALGWALVAVVCIGTVDALLIALALVVPFGRVLTCGYEDWNDFDVMMLRPWPIAFAPVILIAAANYGFYDISPVHALVVPVVWAGSAIQPWLRRQFTGNASNRIAEFVEGACLGAGMGLV